jgi:hypothetical protein
MVELHEKGQVEKLDYGLEVTEDNPAEEGNTGSEREDMLAADIGQEDEPTAVADDRHLEGGYFEMVGLVPTRQLLWRLS